MLVERPLAEIIFRTRLKTKVSRGFQYTAGGNPTFRVPCVLVSTQPSSYSKDGYIQISVNLWAHLCSYTDDYFRKESCIKEGIFGFVLFN